MLDIRIRKRKKHLCLGVTKEIENFVAFSFLFYYAYFIRQSWFTKKLPSNKGGTMEQLQNTVFVIQRAYSVIVINEENFLYCSRIIQLLRA